MKKRYITIASICLLNSCSYDNEDDLYGLTICDTISMSFEADIFPIINEHCSTCHSGPTPPDGLALLDYNQIQISANDASTDGMIHRIEKADGEAGIMPQAYRLPQCQIDMIKAWVAQGTLNN